jgi:hypothetical protein
LSFEWRCRLCVKPAVFPGADREGVGVLVAGSLFSLRSLKTGKPRAQSEKGVSRRGLKVANPLDGFRSLRLFQVWPWVDTPGSDLVDEASRFMLCQVSIVVASCERGRGGDWGDGVWCGFAGAAPPGLQAAGAGGGGLRPCNGRRPPGRQEVGLGVGVVMVMMMMMMVTMMMMIVLVMMMTMRMMATKVIRRSS